MEHAFKWNVFFVRLTADEIQNLNMDPITICKITFTPGLWFTCLKSTKKRVLEFNRPVCYQGRYKTAEDDLLLVAPFKIKPYVWVEGYYNIQNEQLLALTNPGQGYNILPTAITTAVSQEFEKYPEIAEQLSLFG